MFRCSLRTNKFPIFELNRQISSKSSQVKTKRIPQKAHNQISQLQFGPLLRSKSLKRKSKSPPICLSQSDESRDFWLSTVKVTSLPEQLTCTSSSAEFNLTLNNAKKITMKDTLENSSEHILQIPFQRQEDRNYPSVSKILRETMSEENRRVLEIWEQKMILKLGQDGFNQYKQTTFSRGKAIHSWIEKYFLSGRSTDTGLIQDDVTLRHISSISPLLNTIRDVKVLESATFHPDLKYCGIIDCVARIGNTVCLIDWKTSEKAKPSIESLYDNPLQVVAYLGALNADPEYRRIGRIQEGVVIVIYNSGYPAVLHRINPKLVSQLWKVWLERLKTYQNLD